ncbi:MAG: ABC transporter permease [Bacteroidota bacterium]
MVKNFIKTALRSLAKNPLISFINIFGLSLAVGCSLVVFIFVDFAFSQDEFHTNRENIFLIKNVVSRDGSEQVWGDSPAPIGPMMKEDLPEVAEMTRVDNRNVILKYEDKVFKEFVRFVDPQFLEMFSFDLKQGRAADLKDPSKIILSEAMAEKYFGEANPLGKQLVMVLNEKKESFVVGGVAAKFPKTASFRFNFLVHYSKMFTFYEDQDANDWTDFIAATFVQLHNPEDIDALTSKMDKYVKLQNAADEDWPAKAYPFEPLTTLSQNSHKIRGDISGGDDPVARLILISIAVFMIVLACFNYINISISSAAKRLKEIGVRKVIGGTRRQLVFQFIGENLIICVIALVLGGVWARAFFGPWFDSQFDIGLELNFYENINAWVFLMGLLFLTGFGSGSYPAFYISSFKPVNIFRGNQKFSKKGRFTRIFLTFQFILSIITIVFGIAFTQNAQYQRELDWGYNQDQTLVIPLEEGVNHEIIKNELAMQPGIISIATSAGHVGRSVGLSVIDVDDNKYEVRRMSVGYDYLETVGIRLKQGRFFERDRITDQDESVVINETFAQDFGWENPLEASFELDSTTYNVIGVVEDFHYFDFDDKIEPAFFRMSKDENTNFISARIEKGNIAKTEAFAEELWKKHVPDLPYNGFFQDEVFDYHFDELKGHARIMSFTATLAIILSCMGLFGLVSLNVTARMKEFSIRKVLGAGVGAIFNGVNRQYIWILTISCILGLPVAYVLVDSLFDEVYEYHMPLTIVPFVLAAIFLFIVALVTVSSQIYKVVVSNPVDALRQE